ncbi:MULTISPECIES: type II secretion system minor pseudopilin GspK [Psychrobacter]|uniref:type II secretion system minor pseudopilin GspK n=1 Tax=Psychrobacter TaxID=497 RepID=UPI00146F71EA|nr:MULTISPECIES: type II secretion system minor pseudopilin GspK [Psychrobacter]
MTPRKIGDGKITGIRRERGVALLTVLLLVVSITVVAGAMLASQKIAIRKSSVTANQSQLIHDIHAAETLAVTVIQASNALSDTDGKDSLWSQPLPPIPIGNHSVSLQITDEASKFNLNNLYHDGKVDTAALKVMQRLLVNLNLEPKLAIAILDWQDPDSEVYQDGGDEAAVYQSANPVTIANQPFLSIDDLQDIPAMDADKLATLKPFVTAVPYYLPINVNTASPELLAALIDGATTAQLKPLIAQRDNQPLENLDSVWQIPPFSQVASEQKQQLTSMLAVNSQAFLAMIEAADAEQSSRQRFATVLISNLPDNEASKNRDIANNNENANAENKTDNSAKKTVKVISQRFWAFNPTI